MSPTRRRTRIQAAASPPSAHSYHRRVTRQHHLPPHARADVARGVHTPLRHRRLLRILIPLLSKQKTSEKVLHGHRHADGIDLEHGGKASRRANGIIPGYQVGRGQRTGADASKKLEQRGVREVRRPLRPARAPARGPCAPALRASLARHPNPTSRGASPIQAPAPCLRLPRTQATLTAPSPSRLGTRLGTRLTSAWIDARRWDVSMLPTWGSRITGRCACTLLSSTTTWRC